MASQQAVKRYIAYWFQLGKKVFANQRQVAYAPELILQGDRYSQEFEQCWEKIQAAGGQDCYLEGTEQTIAELLTPTWEISDCVRCDMPIPLRVMGMPPNVCPCHDVPTWPNSEIPAPRSPISSTSRLTGIRHRLQQQEAKQEAESKARH